MTVLFRHGFADGLGPFVTRHVTQDLPAADDCAVARRGMATLRVKDEPLRTGHLWVPPEVFAFTNGYVEARVRFQAPKGAHSAVWCQSTTPQATPADHEVDLAEHFGDDRNVQHTVWARALDGSLVPARRSTKTVTAADWHVWGCEMRPDGYTFTVDGRETATIGLPSTRPKTLILSILADDWERPSLNLAELWRYRFRVDWIQVSSL